MYAGGVEMDMYIAMSVRWGCEHIAMSVRWGCRDGYVHSYVTLRQDGCALVVCFIILMLSRYNTYDNDTMLQYTYMYSILHGRFSCATE